jgi:tRNA(Ile)-lysidine synthase
MLHQFRQYINDNHLFTEKDKILAAVSGGMDSVALCSMLSLNGFKFGIAHCNFNLRGDESDADEEFVRQLALAYGVKFYAESFGTAEYAKDKGISIQMAARDLRYAWFDKLLTAEGYNVIATAHHLDDQSETFFINILRGAGLAGIHGILPKQGNIVRPMLFADREQIDDFVRDNRLAYREDSSNKSRKYLRNRLRHELMPVLKDIDPGFSQKLGLTIHHIRGVENILNQEINRLTERIIIEMQDHFVIEISEIRELKPLNTWLYFLLQPFGFSVTVINEITEAIDGISGKIFFSPTHRLVKDRDELIIESLANLNTQQTEYLIDEETPGILHPFQLEFNTIPVAETPEIMHNFAYACLDAEKLIYPLILRLWRTGDRFMPFGMNGGKKVSDFLTDLKLSVPEKEKTWLMLSAGEVVWVVGKRIDARFAVTKKTQKVKMMHLIDSSPHNGIIVERN